MQATEADLATAVERRRTFAIISHPDAGKTTLTEKLLLYGGAINTAGQVAARRRARQATSDWMELERERGISITSTVLQFPYKGCTLNLLDTPGHQDFGEDTYRTLLAADSAVMLIDAAKGVEPQTKKLFAICRARRIPLFTFINKLDRPSRDPLELLDELEKVLGIAAYPLIWPLGNGPSFRGVYDRRTHDVHLFERTQHGAKRAPVRVTDVGDPHFAALTDETTYREFCDGLELLEGAGAAFDRGAFLTGDATPVFFGSAVTNFGVELFLDAFIGLAPPPRARAAALDGSGKTRDVLPASDDFSGFVFKIQANMDPRHRDRVAFLRVCSGRFQRDMTVRNMRTGKDVRVTRAMKLFASEREVVDEAYAGDVVGLANPGSFAIGDTLCAGTPVTYDRIPSFAPEFFASVRNVDTGAYKSFGKGVAQLAEEGAIQVFYAPGSMRSEPIFAAVGELQFEVAKYRLAAEYNVKTEFLRLPFSLARRVVADAAAIRAATWPSNARQVEDGDGAPVALFESGWSVRLAQEWNPLLRFEPFEASARLAEAVG
ncbi:MAG: peptide chain release factor 3 [Candidatus Eremiobacteraeota bacterium]|nr:peptide chain release factor 3 [Candidatus Eremiobacteraeota bacterium]MBC5803163.1 peptide chain release factor 3 [Candidatus Eremiobacteraeota bacterium]MBC5822962.1 peptide chain release factor 3 [Candidatus Eremiobacteraeota bacterium]